MTWPGSTGAPAGVASNIVTCRRTSSRWPAPPGTTSHRTRSRSPTSGPGPVTVHTGDPQLQHDLAAARRRPRSTRPPCRRSPTRRPGHLGLQEGHASPCPTGTDRLSRGPRAQRAERRPPIVRVSLFAPDGTYAANSRPQGGAATAELRQCRRPSTGGRHLDRGSLLAGPVASAATCRLGDQRTGVRPAPSPVSFTVPPGVSKHVKFSCTMPSKASGDRSVAVTLSHVGGAPDVGLGGDPHADRHRPGNGRLQRVGHRRQRARRRRRRRPSATSSTSRRVRRPATCGRTFDREPERAGRPGPDRPERRALGRRQQPDAERHRERVRADPEHAVVHG